MRNHVGLTNGEGKIFISASLGCEYRQRIKIGQAFLGMHVQHALGELRHLGDAAGNGYPFDGVAA
ncbi:hypothetical protein D3C87_1413150 [compost metagenome]